MKGKTTLLLLLGMVMGVAIGGFAGTYLPQLMLALGVIGELYIGALTVLVATLIVSGLIVAINGLGDYRKLGYSLGKASLYYGVTGLLAVGVGLVVALVMQPGKGYNIPWSSTGDMFPGIGDLYGLYAGLVIFAVIFGGVLATMGVKGRSLVSLCRAVNDSTGKLVNVMFYLAPLGLLFITGTRVATEVPDFADIATAAAGYPLAVIIALVVFFVVLVPVTLRLFGDQPIMPYVGSLGPALLAAFGTSSSASALPFTYQAVVNNSRVDQRAGGLVLPLGLILNFGPTAMIVVIASLFIAQATGTSFGILEIALLVPASIVASIGLVGVPRVVGPLLIFVLGLIGAVEGVIAGVMIVMIAEWLIDPLRGVANVWADACGAAVVSETFEFKTARKAPSRPISDHPGRPLRGGRSPRPSDTARRGDVGRGRDKDRSSRTRRERGPRTNDRADRSGRDQARPDRADLKDEKLSPFALMGSSAPALDVESGRPRQPQKPLKSVTEDRPRPKPPVHTSPVDDRRGRAPRADDQKREPVRTGGDRTEKPRPGQPDREKVKQDLARISAQLKSLERAPEQPVEKKEPVPAPVPFESESAKVKPVEPSEAKASDSRPGSEKPVGQTITPGPPVLNFPKIDLFATSQPRETETGSTPKPVADSRPMPETSPVEREPEAVRERPVDREPEVVRERPVDRETPAVIASAGTDQPEPRGDYDQPTPEVEDDGARDSEPEGPSVSFGRGHRRRGQTKTDGSIPKASSEESEDTDTAIDGFSKENVTFGRSKRKRTR